VAASPIGPVSDPNAVNSENARPRRDHGSFEFGGFDACEFLSGGNGVTGCDMVVHNAGEGGIDFHGDYPSKPVVGFR